MEEEKKRKLSEELSKEIDKISKEYDMPIAEMTQAITGFPKILTDSNLFKIINEEFDKLIVDEEQTRKAIFICGCGAFVKNLSATFNILVNGNSSAGKSWVTKNVLSIFPEEVFSKTTYRTRISPRALTYWHNSKVEPEWTWNGKILYLEDIGNDILNSDVFKVMTSEGSTATVVGKYRGKSVELPTTFDIEINGKPITFVTTAIGTPIEEIKNRFLLIDMDESEEQTEKIMKKQIESVITGTKLEYSKEIINALGFLERVEIIIPKWIKNIISFIPRKEVLRWRREFPRFLEIIKCSAALHQFQRESIDGKIVACERDYEIAKEIIGKISASSGVEGLTHRERNAYNFIKQYYKENENGCTRSKIYAFKPVYSDRQWERLLEKLAEKGLLYVQILVDQDTNRKAAHFFPIEFKNLFLPEFSLLSNPSGHNGRNLPATTDNGINKKEGKERENSVIHNVMEIMSTTSTNKHHCHSCDLYVFDDDWNSKTKMCIFCSPEEI